MTHEEERAKFLATKEALNKQAKELGTEHHGVVLKGQTYERVKISLPSATMTPELKKFLTEWTGLHYFGASYVCCCETKDGRDYHWIDCYTD